MVPKWFDRYIDKTLKIQNNLKKALKDYSSICPIGSEISILIKNKDIKIEIKTKEDNIDVLGNKEI